MRTPRLSWLSPLFGRGPRTPIRRAPKKLLGFESLEDRIVPVTQVDLGGLRFLASADFDFDSGTGQFSLFEPGEYITVGFTPALSFGAAFGSAPASTASAYSFTWARSSERVGSGGSCAEAGDAATARSARAPRRATVRGIQGER